jgi:phosphoribosylformylglycinamidine synthase subunit PurSL
LDNFCWCSSKDPVRLGQLKAAVQACYDIAVAYQTPFISGKDSMFNDFSGYNQNGQEIKISILPTLLISAIGIIGDVRKSISIDFKIPGDLVYILGNTFTELGASEYYHYLGQKSRIYKAGNQVPDVKIKENMKIYQTLSKCIKAGYIVSAIGCNIGGLAVALVKSAVAGQLGLNINLQKLPGKISRDDTALFSESQGRIVVSINPDHQIKFEKLMHSIPYKYIGKVTEKPDFMINGLTGNTIVKTDVVKLNQLYKSVFTEF